MPIVAREQVPLIVTASATSISDQSEVGGNDWTFKITPTDASMAKAVVDWLDKEGAAGRIAFLGEATDFGRAGLDGFVQALATKSKKLFSEDLYQQGTADFSSVLAKINAQKPSALALYAQSADQQNIVSQMAAYGVRVPLTGKLQTDVMPKEVLASGLLDGSTAVQPYASEIDTPINNAFVAAYMQKAGSPPNSVPYSSYEAMRVLLDSIGRAKAVDRAAVRDAMKATKLPSVLGGVIEFDDHHLAHDSAVILRIEGGKARVVGLSKT